MMPNNFGRFKILGCILVVLIIIVTFPLRSAAQAHSKEQYPETDRPRYVFLFIGDGMGIAHREAVEQYLTDRAFEPGSEYEQVKLVMDQFTVGGLTKTENSLGEVTDSAAAATSIATGQKTANGVISMSADHTASYRTIAEIAHTNGWKVGIVTSVSLNHATPAAFYAHTSSREDLDIIWRQLIKSQFDYFAGGGIDQTRGQFARFARMAGDAGYTITRTRQDFQGISPETGKVIAINPVLNAHMEMPYVVDAGSDSISLADFTEKGIAILNNQTGFFMMVEGGRIDYASHANDSARMVGEILAFDEAIARAFEFYLQHPAETLIVVTADHETGGLIRITPRRGGEMRILPDVYQSWVGANPLRIRNSSSHGYSSDEVNSFSITSALANTVLLPNYAGSIPSNNDDGYDLVWTNEIHTRSLVLTTAVGAGSEVFSGTFENTEIFSKILELTGLAE